MSLEQQYDRLKEKLPWSSPIYLPTDAVPLEQRVEGLRRVVQVHTRDLDRIYRPKLRRLREQFSHHRRCFIIGNGPSLNRTDLSQLAGEVTFCTNAFFLKFPELDWRPTFHVIEDHLVAEDRATAANGLTGITKLYPAYLAYCLDPGPDTIFFNHRARKSYPHGFDFSTDAARITYTGCTVTFTCMQLAYYLGFDEIFLIGVDADYTIPEKAVTTNGYGTAVLDMDSDDPNHFHPDYFGKGKRWHDPQVDQMVEAYKEARKTAEANGRRIYNATVGGKLEVFPRRNFSSLFPGAIPPERLDTLRSRTGGLDRGVLRTLETESREMRRKTHLSPYPKLLILDMTPVGGVTATGALKETLLRPWPVERRLDVSCHGREEFACSRGPVPPHGGPAIFTRPGDVRKLIEAYDPDVILYRPLPDKPRLHTLAMEIIGRQKAPWLIWIMDDWLSRLERSDPKAFPKWQADMKQLVAGASGNLSISEIMSTEMERRFERPFLPVSNGIVAEEWPAPSHDAAQSETVRIRYSGGLAEDMSLASVLRLAEAVERLSGEYDVRLEINTRSHWFDRHGKRFAGFKATSISLTELPRQAYVDWLREGDILAMAYNFDDVSLAYARYSMANKLPELLASGRPVLAIGPVEQAGMAFLEANDLAARVNIDDTDALVETLRPLIASSDLRMQAGRKGRDFALKELRLDSQRERLETTIRNAARKRTSPPAEPDTRALSALIRMGQTAMAPTDAGDRPQLPRAVRILRFYAGWRGAIALLALAALVAPALFHWGDGSALEQAIRLLPVLGGAILIFFVGYLYTVFIDHVSLLENRLAALARRTSQGQSVGRD